MSANKQRSQKATKTETPVVESTPVVSTPVVSTPSVVEASVSSVPVEATTAPAPVVEETQTGGTTLVSAYDALQARLGRLAKELSDTRTEVKRFYKLAQHQTGRGRSRRRNTSSSPRQPTGFGKPKAVPEKLRVLLGLEQGAELPRPSVTGRLYAYINEHKLHDEKDTRIMRVNADLAQVFGFTKQQQETINSATKHDDENGLNFYNIQKHIARLYPVAGSVAATTPAPPAPVARVTVEAETVSAQPVVRKGKASAK